MKKLLLAKHYLLVLVCSLAVTLIGTTGQCAENDFVEQLYELNQEHIQSNFGVLDKLDPGFSSRDRSELLDQRNRKHFKRLFDLVTDKYQEATASIEFVVNQYVEYRNLNTEIAHHKSVMLRNIFSKSCGPFIESYFGKMKTLPYGPDHQWLVELLLHAPVNPDVRFYVIDHLSDTTETGVHVKGQYDERNKRFEDVHVRKMPYNIFLLYMLRNTEYLGKLDIEDRFADHLLFEGMYSCVLTEEALKTLGKSAIRIQRVCRAMSK